MADYNVHVYMRQDGLAGTVTADLEYPPRVAFVLLTQASRGGTPSVFWWYVGTSMFRVSGSLFKKGAMLRPREQVTVASYVFSEIRA